MSIVVTGATGHLGRLVVEDLLDNGVPADQIIATGRSIEKITDLADRGVDVRRVDFDDPSTIDGVISAGDKVLLVSGSEPGGRVAQHQVVIDAAATAGVAEFVYTSFPKADTTTALLAAEHTLTEAAITAAGLPAVFLRNGLYFEVFTGDLDDQLSAGQIVRSTGDGAVSGAARSDLAAAAAVVLAGDPADHVGHVYELGGDQAFTLAELAAAITAATGTTVTFTNVTSAEHAAAYADAGLPAPLVEILVDLDAQIAAGAAVVDSGDLARLLGRPTVTLDEALAETVASRD